MENNYFNYCPKCGAREIQTLKNGYAWRCEKCGLELFNNVAAAVSAVIVNDKGEALLEVRAKEPYKGMLALPGGFMEMGETAEMAMERECKEEIGFAPEDLKYLGIFPNGYPYAGFLYNTCDIFFEGKMPREYDVKLQESEVSELVWRKVDTKEAVEALPLAFDSARKALLKWLRQR